MKKLLNIGLIFAFALGFVGVNDGFAAASKSAKKQAAISIGTKVRTKVEAKGIYDQECYDQYYSCMDQFCIVDNEIGGSCNCSDDISQYQSTLDEIKNMLAEAERISTEEVEKVQAGANADIIFNGTRTYDKDNNVVQTKATKDKSKIKTSLWSSWYDEDAECDEDGECEFSEDEVETISSKTGKDLYNAANRLCREQMDSKCSKDMDMLVQTYSRQIVSDCKGLANSIEQKKSEAKSALASANAAVRSALKESLEESNKYDRGTCMVEYKKCMRSEDACGSDWENCVFTIAAENMQNNSALNSVAGTKVKTTDIYNITPSTMEILESKRFICEKVLDQCVAVRDFVWNDFLREAAPTIRLAEQNIESNKRQSCLTDISDCIQEACKDDIVGKGTATMDACLARPDMARSFCKNQIEPCERMEPQIWDYVTSKLAAMRVDACTQEVKDCLTDENRCGENYVNCIGMDFDYIHEMCPVDKLVVCKQAKPDFKIEDLDGMLMGLFLNIDNKALENCQKIVEQKMVELCGSTTDCNAFAADEYLGTSSVVSRKEGTIYRVTGMISFGSIKMGDVTGSVTDNGRVLKPGEIGVEDYIKEVKHNNRDSNIENVDGIISMIEQELKNIAGTINRTTDMLELSDPNVSYCVYGRDLSQINGKSNKKGKNTTAARFPNLLNQYRVVIAASALRRAQSNYNKKVTEAIEKASRNSSVDIAQFMCNKIGAMGNIKADGFSEQDSLTTPYAISYDVGTGLSTKALMQGGSSTVSQGGGMSETSFGNGRRKYTVQNSGISKSREATFNRETRICHVCTTTTTTDCNNVVKYLKASNDCKTNVGEPVCEDIQM